MSETKQIGYAVLRLNTSIDVIVNGVSATLKMGDLLGFIAVYETYEQAEALSESGKYQIVPLTLG